MPKLKTRKAAAKRFQATGGGKFLRRRAFRNHLLDHKSPKRKRYLGTMPRVLSVETPCGSWKVKSEGVPSQCRESM